MPVPLIIGGSIAAAEAGSVLATLAVSSGSMAAMAATAAEGSAIAAGASTVILGCTIPFTGPVILASAVTVGATSGFGFLAWKYSAQQSNHSTSLKVLQAELDAAESTAQSLAQQEIKLRNETILLQPEISEVQNHKQTLEQDLRCEQEKMRGLQKNRKNLKSEEASLADLQSQSLNPQPGF